MLQRSSAAVLLVALLAAGAAHAQLKPSKGSEPLTPGALSPTPAQAVPPAPTAPTAPAAPAAPAANSAAPTAKETAAANAAADWLKLIDAGEYGKSWDQCAPLFREKVSRQTWVDGLPKSRAAHGAFKSRSFSAAASRTSLRGAPDGEYVLVRFLSDFEKATAVEELVTMVFVGGAWRPTGYALR